MFGFSFLGRMFRPAPQHDGLGDLVDTVDRACGTSICAAMAQREASRPVYSEAAELVQRAMFVLRYYPDIGFWQENALEKLILEVNTSIGTTMPDLHLQMEIPTPETVAEARDQLIASVQFIQQRAHHYLGLLEMEKIGTLLTGCLRLRV